jgi:membrane associated rhomboid family serine protease
VTATIIVVFLYQVSLDSYTGNHFITVYGLIPDRLDPPDLITSMFLHGGWLHLIGNMWFLWIYGDNVEDVLGHGKFALFYLLCGLGAALVHVMFNPYSRIPTVGASGAIAGVMGAYLIKFPHSHILTLVPIFVFFTTVELPAVIILAYWFILQIFSGIGSIGFSIRANVSATAATCDGRRPRDCRPPRRCGADLRRDAAAHVRARLHHGRSGPHGG